MSKALIISLGGSIEPIIKSIEEHKPDYLCFFSSQESNTTAYPVVKKHLDEAGVRPKIESVVVDDKDDLVHCYEKAMEISTRIEKQSISPKDVVIDYTGGTKNMTAALVLATIAKGYKFSYIGGKERDKEGLGVVKSGSEEIKTALSPWQVLLVEDRKKIALYFNSYQFSAARGVADKLSESLGEEHTAIYKCLSELIEGYRLWDSFKHDRAFACFEEGMKKLPNYLKVRTDAVLSEFVKRLGNNLSFLKNMKNETNEFKELRFPLVFDLLHNAKRRAEEGKYDDAVARLYRALEMLGQIEFEKEIGCPTSAVDLEKIPESLRDEIKRKHSTMDENSGEERVKIGLKETFNVLKEKGNKFATHFFEKEKEIGSILSARNSSILAHGQTPVAKETFDKLCFILQDFLKHTNLDYKVEFPKIRWE